MTHKTYRWTTAALTLGLLAPMASAKSSVDKKTAWGAATAGLGVGAIVEASKHPVEAAVMAAGAVYAYTQYDKAAKEDSNRSSTYRRTSDGYYDNSGVYHSVRRTSNDNYYDPYGNNGTNRWDPNADRTGRDGYNNGYGYNNNYSYNNSRYGLTGVVVGETSTFDRNIKVRLDNGDTRTVEVPKDTPVRRDGEAISIHDVKKGDTIGIQLERGYSTRNDNLRASRIDVLGNGYYGNNDPYYRNNNPYNRNDPYYNNGRNRNNDPYYNGNGYGYGNGNAYGRNITTSGSVNSIDSRSGVLRMDVDGRRVTVYTDNADIIYRGRSTSLRDLERGDRVTVEGRRSGDTIYATRVTVR